MTAISTPFHGLATELHLTTDAALNAISGATLVGEVASVGTLELSANIIEYNSHGSAYKQKLVGQKDSGTLSLSVNWIAGDTHHTALKAAFDAGSLENFAIRWVSGSENATSTFTGYIASFSMESPVEDVVTASIEIAIDGAVAFDLVTAI